MPTDHSRAAAIAVTAGDGMRPRSSAVVVGIYDARSNTERNRPVKLKNAHARATRTYMKDAFDVQGVCVLSCVTRSSRPAPPPLA